MSTHHNDSSNGFTERTKRIDLEIELTDTTEYLGGKLGN
jgi:hypothetical protein